MKIDMIVSQEKETVEAHEQRQMRNEMTTGVVVISPHHSRAISLQGKSDIALCRTDITLSR